MQIIISGYAKISIHALLAESDVADTVKLASSMLISIHALLAESDDKRCKFDRHYRISIHALLAESDPKQSIHHKSSR